MHIDPSTHQRRGRMLILICAAAVAAFFLWASWAELDQITRAQGQVIASSRNQVIQAPDGGIIEDILAKEGAAVKKGQVLIRFDKAKAEASYLETRAKEAALLAAIARLRAEVYGTRPQFAAELRNYPDIRASEDFLFEKRRHAVEEEIRAIERSKELVQAELDINLPLLKNGDVSRADVLRLQRQIAEMDGQITNRRNKYYQDAQTDLSKALEELAGVKQVVAQRKDQLDHTVITSPMDGVVRNVRITTLTGVARPADEIMQIVPVEDDLLIEAKVRPSDIAFVKPGLPASIKLDAYDYTIYGALSGAVSYISVDTLNDENRNSNEPPYYRVQVKTKVGNFGSGTGKHIEVQPGMTATVEIKTGSNTVLRYLTKPVLKTMAESLGER